MNIIRLKRENTGLLLVDFQEKLIPVMHSEQKVVASGLKLLHLARLYKLPVILTEQYPKWLGSTMPEIKEHLSVYEPVQKMEFDCCEQADFQAALKSEKWAGVENIVLTGVESHICILQTCMSLLEQGYKVHVPYDAVASRSVDDHHIGLELMRQSGAIITGTETIIFQMLQKAGSKEFKEMLKLVK